MEKNSIVLWFTGMSGAGKTTLAQKIVDRLEKKGLSTLVLDGDDIRNHHHRHLSFSKEDILENNRLIADLCAQKLDQYNAILVPIISPYALGRQRAREKIGSAFHEIYVKASLDKLIQRDTKGLYRKSLNGEMDDLIGFSEKRPYEEPQNPDCFIQTDLTSPDQNADELMECIRQWMK